jgi:hypothetical protein
MKVEGERGPRFQIFDLDIEGNPHECVFESDEPSELERFKRRADKRYKWRIDGRWMTVSDSK